MRAMSTASLAIRSMALITWSTDDMPSESFGLRTAMMHTARMSCTRSLIVSSSSPTSSAMSGSPKYSDAYAKSTMSSEVSFASASISRRLRGLSSINSPTRVVSS